LISLLEDTLRERALQILALQESAVNPVRGSCRMFLSQIRHAES
jgi:hypothetical protein